jgi:phosphomannomutase
VDTEAVSESMLADIQALADANGGASLDAVVSTDGDSDRPLVLAVDGGRLRFIPGDILGMIAADSLGVRRAAVAVSASDALEAYLCPRGIRIMRTRIGSPYVIAAIVEGGAEAGWEANGGFLTAAPLLAPGGGSLGPLATRDALLPMLAVLYASLGRGMSLAEVLARLPPRFGLSSVLRPFPREKALAIIASLSPADHGTTEAHFEEPSGKPPRARVIRMGDSPEPVVAHMRLAGELEVIRGKLERFFTPRDGFGPVVWINWLDGVRVGFANGDVVHVRPSGNAPGLRIYAFADSPERVEAIVACALRCLAHPVDIPAAYRQILGIRLPG